MRKKIILSAIIIVAALIGFKSYQKHEIQQSIAHKILRFHVLANSDSDADQNVKKQVRDAVGTYLRPYLEECSDMKMTREVVNEHMQEVIEVSKDVLRNNGFTYNVTAEITHTDFPEKVYGEYTFPAGEYEALEIRLGNGEGHNWWCVLYPNMCFKGTVYEVVEDEACKELKEVLSPKEYETVFNKGNYKIRFKILEIFR